MLIAEGKEGALAEALYQLGLSHDGLNPEVKVPDPDRWAVDRVLSSKRLAEGVMRELVRIAPEFVAEFAREATYRERVMRESYMRVQPSQHMGIVPQSAIEAAANYIPKAYPKRNQ